MNYRVILYHKQATSARTRFVRFAGNTVFAFGPSAGLSQYAEGDMPGGTVHPSAVMQQTEAWLGLPQHSLRAETAFQHAVEAPSGSIQVLLAAFTTMDPPFEAVEKAGASFIDLTAARGLPPVELEMLRLAYELVLGG